MVIQLEDVQYSFIEPSFFKPPGRAPDKPVKGIFVSHLRGEKGCRAMSVDSQQPRIRHLYRRRKRQILFSTKPGVQFLLHSGLSILPLFSRRGGSLPGS